MSRIFLSHSSANNAEAIAVRDWMVEQGWDDIFLDLDPERGLKAGGRWQEELKAAADRCELVIIIVSPEWAASRWCQSEFLLTKHGNPPKNILPVIVSPTPFADLPIEMTAEYQSVDLAAGTRDYETTVTLPPGDKTETVRFSTEGLDRLRIGLTQSGLDPKFFAWPPEHDPERAPYRGLLPLEAEDAGIFFGRDGPIVTGIDMLRGLKEAAPPRLVVILGASGAGKSSFMRAGLLPRLARDDQHFLPLPIVRPERAVISGESGLLASLEAALKTAGVPGTRASIRTAIAAGAFGLAPLLTALVAAKAPAQVIDGAEARRPPTLILPIDQAEELFVADGADEADPFLEILRDLTASDAPALIALFTIRSDRYEPLQTAKAFEGVRQHPISLSPMPQGAYADVIKGPAMRLDGTDRPLTIEEPLVEALLAEIEAGGAKDALPLLAFTLERLYSEHGGDGDLELDKYRELGGIKGSIEAAVEQALKVADTNPAIPKDRKARLVLLRRSMVPWLAGLDPETGTPRRRVARLSEIPAEARPLMELLVEQRLLATDVSKDTGEVTVEPAHEALLRQWGLLEGWLEEDFEDLATLEGVKRATRDWDANARDSEWVSHAGGRLEAAEKVAAREDFAGVLELTEQAYLAACRKLVSERLKKTRRGRILVNALLCSIIVGLLVWINQALLKEQISWYTIMRPYKVANVDPYVLKPEDERALRPKSHFRECAKSCPEMVVVPGGEFFMGSPATEKGRDKNEGPQHKVKLAGPFAVAKFAVTFADWDACVSVGGCPHIGDSGSGRATRPTKPVTNVTWNEAQRYVRWLSMMTGKTYRLLTESEWEYAARAGSATTYPWGDEIGQGNANCKGCGSVWDGRETSPVGSFKPNAFGLFDMAGNVWQWVQDCYNDNYVGAPDDGSAWSTGDCGHRIVRGVSWLNVPQDLRTAFRGRLDPSYRSDDIGFRVGRPLTPPSVP